MSFFHSSQPIPKNEGSLVPSFGEEVLHSPGNPLDNVSRSFKKSRGHDSSGVRVYSGCLASLIRGTTGLPCKGFQATGFLVCASLLLNKSCATTSSHNRFGG